MNFFVLMLEKVRKSIRSMAMAKPRTKQTSTGNIQPQPPSRNFCIKIWCMLSPARSVSAFTAASCASALTVPSEVTATDKIIKNFFIAVFNKF